MSPAHDDVPIGDYALIGNTHTAALVSRQGSIDWLCWPRFDSPALLCRLLDARRGGFLRVAPVESFRTARAYVPDTCVLQTRFTTEAGEVRITDFMPLPEEGPGEGVGLHRVVRCLEGLAGRVEMELRLRPTFDYARAPVRLTPCPGGAVAEDDGHTSLALVSPAPLHPAGEGEVAGRFWLEAGQRTWVVLAVGAGAQPGALGVPEAALKRQLQRTQDGWRAWAARCTYAGPYGPQVRRSALTLKLLTYAPSGALVAAPTTSLPEEVGGVRNWDYRFTWLRDAALTLYALQRVGYHDEAMAFWGWLEGLQLGHVRPPRIMYRVDGGLELPEEELGHLAGYRASRPVRIGNAAAGQTQLDIYGEVLDAADYCQASMGHPLSASFWDALRFLVDEAARRWGEPDRGIWEVRGAPQHFVHSKLMCWVALDRGLRLAQRTGRAQHAGPWARAREDVARAILERGYHPGVGAFTQAFGSEALDASALLIPLVGLLPAHDARVLSTTRAIAERLTSHGLVHRYRAEDGLPGGEGTFLLCSFWLVDNLALQGRAEEARALFERLLGHANDVGLLAEEVDPARGELLGNFPQAFSHLALIRSALALERAEVAQQHSSSAARR